MTGAGVGARDSGGLAVAGDRAGRPRLAIVDGLQAGLTERMRHTGEARRRRFALIEAPPPNSGAGVWAFWYGQRYYPGVVADFAVGDACAVVAGTEIAADVSVRGLKLVVGVGVRGCGEADRCRGGGRPDRHDQCDLHVVVSNLFAPLTNRRAMAGKAFALRGSPGLHHGSAVSLVVFGHRGTPSEKGRCAARQRGVSRAVSRQVDRRQRWGMSL